MESRIVVVLGIVFMAATLGLYGSTIESFQFVGLEAVLAAASISDLQTRTIPTPCIVAGVGIKAVYFAALAYMGMFDVREFALCIASGVGLYVLLFLFALIFENVTGRQGIGGGDLRLYALGGLFFGFEGGLGVVFLSCILALVASSSASKDRPGTAPKQQGEPLIKLSQTIPFGPAISLACVVVILVSSGAF